MEKKANKKIPNNQGKSDALKKTIKANYKLLIVVLLATAFVIYLLISIYGLIKKPTDLFVIEEGALSQEEAATCYVIRDETVLRGENYKNGMAKIKSEGEKVSVGGAVFRYYTKNEENLVQKIEELDQKIDEAMQNEKTYLPSDILLLESKIETQMDEIYEENDLSKIKQVKQEMEDAVTKKATIAGELSPANSYVKKLIDERASYEDQLNSGSETISTQEAGIVSYKVDGLEEVLTPENFSSVNAEFLESLNLRTGQVISSSEECGKIINNFKFYLAVILRSEEAKAAKLGDSVKIRLSNKELLKAKVTYIHEEVDGARVIIFETTDYSEELISYRKLSIDVVWWSDSGLRVPNSAIITEGDLHYVMRNRAGYLDKILVKILRQNENYAIVDDYTTEELKELGFTSQEIATMKSIAIYDEIMANGE